jgi:acyl carrier protein
MYSDDFKNEIIAIVKEHVGTTKAEGVALDTVFTDAGLDSLDAVELIMKVEEKYDVTISEEKANKLKTVSDLADCVHAELNKNKN